MFCVLLVYELKTSGRGKRLIPYVLRVKYPLIIVYRVANTTMMGCITGDGLHTIGSSLTLVGT